MTMTSPVVAGSSAARRLAIFATVCWAAFLIGIAGLGLIHPSLPAPLIFGVVALPPVGLIAALVARHIARRKDPASTRRAGRAVVICGIATFLLLAGSVLLPSLCRAREPANRAKCANNLRQIGLALLQYAGAHEGRFPPTLETLLVEADLTSEVLICPSGQDERAFGPSTTQQVEQIRQSANHLSYVYAGSQLTATTVTPAHVLAYDKDKNHAGNGINVVFGDAHTEFLIKYESARILAELTAGHNPPRPKDGKNPPTVTTRE